MGKPSVHINYRPLCIFAAFFCLGAACAGAYAVPATVLAVTAIVLLICAFFGYKPGIIACIAVLCGFFRMLIAVPEYRYFPENNHAIHGTICKTYREQAVIDEITVDNVHVSGRMLITEKTELRVGDRIACTGCISTADRSYSQNYLIASGIIYTVENTENLIKTGEHHTLHSSIYSVRYYLHDRIGVIFGDGADIVRAVLLGESSSVDSSSITALRTAGIAHILALSGLHVTILAKTTELLLSFMHRKSRLILSTVLMVLYSAVAGFPVSFVRAVIMLIVRNTAFFVRRRYDALTALGTAAIVVVCANPYTVFTAGFVLSFGAVLSILLISRPVTEKLTDDGSSAVKKTAAQALAASVGITPLTASVFGHISLYAIPFNIVCIPIATAAVAAAFTALVTGLVSVLLSVPFALVANILFRFIEDAAHVVSMLPFSQLMTGGFSIAAVAAWYLSEFFISDYFITEKIIKIYCATASLVCMTVLFLLGT